MKFSNRTKTFAVLTAAAMLLNTTSAIPILNVSAEEKSVSVTLPDWSETLSFADIPQEEYKTTEITIEPDWTGTVTFKDIESSDIELRQLTDDTGSGNYGFSVWDNRSEIIAAINEKDGTSLSDNSVIQVTDISFEYNWELKSEDEKSTDSNNVAAWPDVWGTNADGSSSDHDDLFTAYSETTGSAVFSTATCEDSGVQAIEDIQGFGLGMGAWTNNPEDVLEVSVDSITLTVKYVKQYAGGWKSLDLDGKAWKFDHYIDDDGTLGAVMEQVLAAIKEQEGDTAAGWTVKVNDISMDYEWVFNTDQENPVICIITDSHGFDDSEIWQDACIPEDNTDYQFSGTTGSGTLSASEVAKLAGVDITNYHGMNVNIGAWTDDPDDTLTLSLTNITFKVTYQPETSGDDYSSVYLSYEDLQGAKYLNVSMEVSEKGNCGHDIDHIGEDGIKYYDDWTYCPWPVVEVRRISSDGSIVGDNYSFMPDAFDIKITSAVVSLSDIIEKTGELSEGEQLELVSSSAVTVTDVKIIDSLPDIDLGTGSIGEIILDQRYEWDDETKESVPTGKVDLEASMQLGNFGRAKSLNGYSAIAVDYTLLDPKACSAVVITLHGWEDNGVGWDVRYYPADSKSGRIIIALSDMQGKSLNNVFVGAVAQPAAQIGDSFSPCLTVTDAKVLVSCDEAATLQIDPIEPTDPPEYDEFGRKTASITLDYDWEETISFSDASEGNGQYKSLYIDESDNRIWSFNDSDGNGLNSDMVKALKEKTGDVPCDWPFIINDITVTCEWEFNTEAEDVDLGIMADVGGCVEKYDSEWKNVSVPENEESFKSSEKKGSCNISASRVAALAGAYDISDFGWMNLNIGTYTEDPTATLTLRVTSVKLNVSYTPRTAVYLSYDELKDAKYVKIYSDVKKMTECGHKPDHIGDDGVSYFDDWTYCPWSPVEVRLISADGTVSAVYEAWADQYDMSSVTALKKISDITAVTGELSEGDMLEFASTPMQTVPKAEALDDISDIQLDPVIIEQVAIEEACDWDPEFGSVPNGKVNIMYTETVLESASEYKCDDYAAIKINYTLKNPDECSAIVVIIHGWGKNGEWRAKYYPISGNSGTIVVDLSDLEGKTFYKLYVGVTAQPTVQIGDTFTPGFEMKDGALLGSYSDAFTEEIDPVEPYDPDAELAKNIEIVDKIYAEESDDPYILTDDELAAVEAVLDYDYNK